MKLDKLARQARRDLAANPKKAAVLGLMLLVAGYFWGPLLWKWLMPAAGKKGDKGGQTELILEDDPAEPVAKSKSGVVTKPFRWEKVRQQIRSDRFMAPALFEPDWPNPFAPLKVTSLPEDPSAPNTEPGAAGAAKPKAEITPTTAGLKLEGVAIGPRRRTATISGNTYRAGAIVAADGKEPGATLVGFRVARIEPEGVELEREGKTWWIEFDKPNLAQGDEIGPATENDDD